MNAYIKINKENIKTVERLLNENDIMFELNNDPLYYTIESTVTNIVKNNLTINKQSEINDMLDFVYEDFNNSVVLEEIINKMIIYENQIEAEVV